MAEITADFELGSNGSDILTGDAGSATAWDFSATAGGGTRTYDSTHVAFGSLAAKIIQGTSTGTRLGWTTAFGTQTDHYGRLYLYLTAGVGATNQSIVQVQQDASRAIRLDLTGTPVNLRMFDSAAAFTTGSVSVSLNQLVRIEWHFIHSETVGQGEVKLFNTASSTSPDETITSPASWNTLSNANAILFGQSSGVLDDYTYWMDNIIANATSYPGPFVDPSAEFNLAPVIYGRGAC